MAQTIYAPATAAGRAGVAVVRISGPAARRSAECLAGPLPEEGRKLAHLRDDAGALLDHALVLTFPEGRSFTGQETVELHLHGAPVIVRAVCAALGRLPDLRPAAAGEFTRRAFENGKLDLTQVEGLADLLAAETERQREMALRTYSGDFSARIDEWRGGLISACALVEATIDFSDEELPDGVLGPLEGQLDALIHSLEAEISASGGAERLREGFEVAIVGQPNVGKSTLLNRIAGREAALTSEIAGTTRDVIEVRLEIMGLPVTMLDTAGLRDTQDPVEKMGVARARERAEAADMRVYLVADDSDVVHPVDAQDIVIKSKIDVLGEAEGVSGKTGQGVDGLLTRIGTVLEARLQKDSLASRDRHRVALEDAAGFVRAAKGGLVSVAEYPEMVAEDLRSAIRALETLVGRIDVDHVLGEIFSSFCIGK